MEDPSPSADRASGIRRSAGCPPAAGEGKGSSLDTEASLAEHLSPRIPLWPVKLFQHFLLSGGETSMKQSRSRHFSSKNPPKSSWGLTSLTSHPRSPERLPEFQAVPLLSQARPDLRPWRAFPGPERFPLPFRPTPTFLSQRGLLLLSEVMTPAPGERPGQGPLWCCFRARSLH